MRQSSPLLRTLVVCLTIVFLSINYFAQSDNFTEGSLRVLDSDGKEQGLCPLKNTEVKANVSGFLARVTVTQTFLNPSNETIEAIYAFPLPNDAVVDDMTIQIGSRIVKGKIMEREQAQKTYETAKQEGKVAALLDQQRPNLFTQSVANITPNAEIKVIISYVETLKYSDDTYEFTFPMTVGERYILSSVLPEDAAKISPNSKTRPGHTVSLEINLEAGVPIQDISSITHEIESQQFSASNFAVKLKNENEIPNRDFVLKYKTAGQKMEDALLTHNSGNGGFFSLILQPPDKVFPADTMPKEIVFVLDTSGSMSGAPIEKAKESMMLSLAGLNPNDTFNLITFAGETRILFEKPVPANAENLAKAKKLLSGVSSAGGTEMMTAIKAALAPSDSQNHVRIVCFMTDGFVGNEFAIIDEVKNHPNARVFAFGVGSSVNRFLLDEISREGRGEAEYILPNEDGSKAAKRFYERVRNPLLTDISLEFQGIETSEIFPRKIPDLFDAKPVYVVGRYKNGGKGKVILHGKMQGQFFQREIPLEFPEQNAENDVISTLWARKKVSDLMSQNLQGLQKGEFKDDLKNEIINLGVEFRLMTQFTSFVAVDEQIVTDGTETKRIEVPVAQPQQSGNLPVNGRSVQQLAMLSSGVNATVSVSSVNASIIETKTIEPTASLQFRNDIQSSLPTATGITLTAGSETVEKSGIVSSNGQRTTSNNFSFQDSSANLGVGADEGSLVRNVGALPILTASGGLNGTGFSGATSEVSVKTISSAKEQRVAGSQITFVSKGGTNEFHGSLFETFGNEALNANDFFSNEKNFERAPSRLNQFGGNLGGYFVRDSAFFFGNYEGLRLRQANFGVSEVPNFESRQNASATIRPIYELFPLPNGQNTANGLAEFSANFTNPARNDIFSLRIDGRPGDNLQIQGRFNFADSNAKIRGNDFSLNTLRENRIKTESFSLNPTFVATSTLVFSGNFNFTSNRIGQQFSTDNFGSAAQMPLISDSPFDFLKFDLGGKNSAIAFGDLIESRINQIQTNGSASWIVNNHFFSFGADWRRISLRPGANLSEKSLLFSGANLSETVAQINEISRNLSQNPTLHNFSLFVEDEWRITSRLNLKLGLRWDADFSSEIENFTTDFQNASPNLPNRHKNFAPRVGVAWDVFSDGRAVLRGGGGLYFDYGNPASSEVFANSFPFANTNFARNADISTVPNNSLTPLFVFANDLKTPRTWHFFGEYQQEIVRNLSFSANYTASFGRELHLTRTIFNADPNFGFIRFTDNSAESDFHVAQFRVDRRFSNNFSFSARYQFSKSLDNFSPDLWRESNFLSENLEIERGASDFDARHQLNINGVFDIPRFFDSGWKSHLTEGWTISAVANARTAFPVNVGYYRIQDFGKQFFRADLIGNTPIYQFSNEIKQINPNAFSIPNEEQQGNLGRNSLRGFPFFQLDLGLQRRFVFTSSANLRLAINAFNLLNNTNFANMSGNLGTLVSNENFQPNAFFGKPVSLFGGSDFTPFYLYGGARTIQVSAKFSF